MSVIDHNINNNNEKMAGVEDKKIEDSRSHCKESRYSISTAPEIYWPIKWFAFLYPKGS